MKHTSIKSKVLGSPTKQFLSKNGNDAQLTLVTAVYTIIKAKKIYKLSKHVQQTITNPYSGQMLSHAFTIKSRRSNTCFSSIKSKGQPPVKHVHFTIGIIIKSKWRGVPCTCITLKNQRNSVPNIGYQKSNWARKKMLT